MALGDRGTEVRKEQERLNALGADLVVDGIWGPKTQSAFEKYGAAPGGSTAASPTAGADLLMPGKAKLWFNETTGQYWVVYWTPEVTTTGGKTAESTPYGWLVESDEDLEAVVGPGKTAVPHFSAAEADFTAKGMVDLGKLSEVNLQDLEGDPFDTWVEDLRLLAELRPWLLDDDYIKLAVQASMERVDGAITIEEVQSTKWWREHNPAERYWMETSGTDPAGAQQMLDDNRASMKFRLAQAGIDNASDALVNFMADKVTTGNWSTMKITSQIAALSDPYSVDVIDDELFTFLANEGTELDTTMKMEDTVRDLLQTWLGPTFGAWSDEEIAAKAGELRNNPDGVLEFTEYLKDQRMAMFPAYGDRNVSYAALMQPWKNYTTSTWGVPVEETDETFMKIIQMNDPEEASKLLRSTGFDRGYDKIVNEMTSGIRSGMSRNVRGAV